LVQRMDTMQEDLAACSDLVSQGSVNAVSGLAQMVGQEIHVTNLHARLVPVNETPDIVGGWEELTLGVYLGVSGSANGHMFLLYSPPTALALVDLLLGQPPGTTTDLDEMEESVMGEVGNIMGSFFLTALSDATGLTLQPSPPAVMMDMAGAILDVAMADILQESDDALVVETSFSSEDRQIEGTLLVMPSPDLLRVLKEHLNDGH